MFEKYLQNALNKAEYKLLDTGEWYASIAGYEGVWAEGDSIENTRRELIEVLEEWLILKFKDNDPIPFFDSFEPEIEKEFA